MNKHPTTSFMKILAFLLVCGMFTSCVDSIPHRDTIIPSSKKDDDVKFSRPDSAIKFKSDFCGCKDSKPVTYGNCASFCASKNTNGVETFYANFTVTEAIIKAGFGNVYSWCTAVIDGDVANPKCMIQAKDEDGNIKELEAIPLTNTNSVTANMEPLLFDKTYVLTLIETQSGAKSDSVQIIKFSTDVNPGNLGPIKNSPVSQYTCIVRALSEDSVTGDIYYDSAYRMHFYFLPRVGVSPVPGGQTDLICHDIFNPLYGSVDNASYPRLEEMPGVFNLWDTLDPRFYDNDGSGVKDINQVITQKVRNLGGGNISLPADFFKEFKWMGSPTDSNNAGNNNSEQTMGYYLAPFVDNTFKSYCPTSAHYNGTNLLFKALKDIIGVDTEGIYIGEKAPETVTASDGSLATGGKDWILIRETDIKAVWFYLNNGVATAPTDANVKDVSVFFYYPLNKITPFVKSASQRLYKVKWAYELGGNYSVTTTLPPHDRKLGCIPKF